MNLVQAEAFPDVSYSTTRNILALCKQLVMLVSTGKAKEEICIQLSHKQVKRLTDQEVEKYQKRYEAHVGGKTTKPLIDSVLILTTRVVGTFLPIKNVEELQRQLRSVWVVDQA